jgi:hypothetical protein
MKNHANSSDSIQVIWDILSFPVRFLWTMLFAAPTSHIEAVIVGIIRLATVLFISFYSPNNSYNHLEAFLINIGVPKVLAIIIVLTYGFSWIYWAITGLVHIVGFHSNYIRPNMSGDEEGSGFSNVDEALDFREGVLGMKSTVGKMEEMAKTSFVNKVTFRKMSNISAYQKEAIQFLDGKLGMQSTSGKYEMLKNMFGG